MRELLHSLPFNEDFIDARDCKNYWFNTVGLLMFSSAVTQKRFNEKPSLLFYLYIWSRTIGYVLPILQCLVLCCFCTHFRLVSTLPGLRLFEHVHNLHYRVIKQTKNWVRKTYCYFEKKNVKQLVCINKQFSLACIYKSTLVLQKLRFV